MAIKHSSFTSSSTSKILRGIEQFIGTASIVFFLLGGVSSFVTGRMVASVEEPIGTPGVFFLIGIFGLLVTGVIQAIRNVR